MEGVDQKSPCLGDADVLVQVIKDEQDYVPSVCAKDGDVFVEVLKEEQDSDAENFGEVFEVDIIDTVATEEKVEIKDNFEGGIFVADKIKKEDANYEEDVKFDVETKEKIDIEYNSVEGFDDVTVKEWLEDSSSEISGAGVTSRTSLLHHLLSHPSSKPYSCQICGMVFISKKSLSYHVQNHASDWPFECKKCFYSSGYLKCYNIAHKDMNQFECALCGKSFSQKTSLRIHIMHHLGQKPYTCNICGKCYTSASVLTTHSATHLGEKPYICKMCGNVYPEETSWRLHMSDHLDEKEHKCKICGKCYHSAFNLKAHFVIHSGEEELYTRENPNSNSDFISRTGTSEKPSFKRPLCDETKSFQCENCKKSFWHSRDLRHHAKVHVSNKCESCGIFLSQRNKLKGKPFKCKMCEKNSENVPRYFWAHGSANSYILLSNGTVKTGELGAQEQSSSIHPDP